MSFQQTHIVLQPQVLASLSGRADALKKQLEAHSTQLRKNVDRLLKQQNSGEYSTAKAAVSQRLDISHTHAPLILNSCA